MTNFTVTSVLLCDYVTQDISGKLIAVGIVPPAIQVHQNTPTMIPFYVVVTIQPKAKKFSFIIELVAPTNIVIVHFKCEYDNDVAPNALERCNFNFQIPSVPFLGFGVYRMDIKDGTQVQSFELDVKPEGFPRFEQGRISMSAILNPAFASGNKASSFEVKIN